MDDVLRIRDHAVLVQVETFELARLRDAQRARALTAYIRTNAAASVATVTAPLPIACAINCAVPPP